MNITQTDNKVVMEMTLEEAEEMKKALLWARRYWQDRTQEETGEMVREVTTSIANKYRSMFTEVAEVIGY